MKIVLFYDFEFLGEILSILKDFNVRVEEIAYDRIPENCINPRRNQIDANKLFEYLEEKYRIFAGITDKDIYVEGYNFVFGISSPFRGFILSTYRLKSNDEYLYKERVIKEFLHEFGHLLGLSHCNNYCVMRFSNSVFEVDKKPPTFCEICREKLRRDLRLLSFYGLL